MKAFKDFAKKSDYETDLNIQDLLTYEIANNWFCQFIATDWIQDIVAKRMAKKVQRKYEKFKKFQEILKHVNV